MAHTFTITAANAGEFANGADVAQAFALYAETLRDKAGRDLAEMAITLTGETISLTATATDGAIYRLITDSPLSISDEDTRNEDGIAPFLLIHHDYEPVFDPEQEI